MQTMLWPPCTEDCGEPMNAMRPHTDMQRGGGQQGRGVRWKAKTADEAVVACLILSGRLQVTLAIQRSREGHVVQSARHSVTPSVRRHALDAVFCLVWGQLLPQDLRCDVRLQQRTRQFEQGRTRRREQGRTRRFEQGTRRWAITYFGLFAEWCNTTSSKQKSWGEMKTLNYQLFEKRWNYQLLMTLLNMQHNKILTKWNIQNFNYL